MLNTGNGEMARYRQLVVAPVVTEKSMRLSEEANKYTFKVAKSATKIDIKRAVEKLFNVRVISVNTMTVGGKERRRSYRHRVGKTASWKKAIVTLAAGSSIDVV